MSTVKDAAKRAHSALQAALEAGFEGYGSDALTGALSALADALAASTDLRLARVPAWYARDAEAVVRDATHRHRLIAAGERDPVSYQVTRRPLLMAKHAVIVAAEALERAPE